MERRAKSHVVCGKESKMKNKFFICPEQKKKKRFPEKNKIKTLSLCIIKSTEHYETQASVPLKVGKGNQQHL